MRYFLFGFFMLWATLAFTKTIRGVLVDQETGQPISGANVWLTPSGMGCMTSATGEFVLEQRLETETLHISHIAYQKFEMTIHLTDNLGERVIVEISPGVLEMPSVQIEAIKDRDDAEMLKFEPGALIIDAPKLYQQSFVGEPDILRALKNLPGVVANNELTAEIHVCGGSSDHDLLLVDGIPLIQSHHLLGIFSALNTSMISHVSFSPGGFTSQYGNYLGALTKVKTRFNYGITDGEAMFSMISSNFFFQTDAGKLHLSLAARRTYLDALLKLMGKDLPFWFSDVYTRWGYQLGANSVLQGGVAFFKDLMKNDYTSRYEVDNLHLDSLSAKAYFYEQRNKFEFPWRSYGAWLTWERMLQPEWLLTGKLYHSRASNDMSSEQTLTFYSGNEDQYWLEYDSLRAAAKRDYAVENWYQENSAKIEMLNDRGHEQFVRFGAQFSWYQFHYGWQNFDYDDDSDYALYYDYAELAEFFRFRDSRWYGALYFESTFSPNPLLMIRPGLRLEQTEKYTAVLSPRCNLVYRGLAPVNVSLAVGRYYQTVATARERGLLGFLDLRFPTQPESADHVVLGLEFQGENLQWLVNGYYKKFGNLLKSIGPAPDFVHVDGWATGLELQAQGKWRRLSGEVVYTLAQTNRRYQRETYQPPYDIRHNLLLNLNLKTGAHWHFTAAWSFATGAPYYRDQHKAMYRKIFIDPATGAPIFTGSDYALFDLPQGAVRYPCQHRLDIGFVRELGEKRWSMAPFLQIYNVYNHENVLVYRSIGSQNIPATGGPKVINNRAYYRNYDSIPFLPTVGLRVRL